MLDFTPLEDRICIMEILISGASFQGHKFVPIIQEISEVLERERSRVDLAVERYADGQKLTSPYKTNTSIHARCVLLDDFIHRMREKIETALTT